MMSAAKHTRHRVSAEAKQRAAAIESVAAVMTTPRSAELVQQWNEEQTSDSRAHQVGRVDHVDAIRQARERQ